MERRRVNSVIQGKPCRPRQTSGGHTASSIHVRSITEFARPETDLKRTQFTRCCAEVSLGLLSPIACCPVYLFGLVFRWRIASYKEHRTASYRITASNTSNEDNGSEYRLQVTLAFSSRILSKRTGISTWQTPPLSICQSYTNLIKRPIFTQRHLQPFRTQHLSRSAHRLPRTPKLHRGPYPRGRQLPRRHSQRHLQRPPLRRRPQPTSLLQRPILRPHRHRAGKLGIQKPASRRESARRYSPGSDSQWSVLSQKSLLVSFLVSATSQAPYSRTDGVVAN